MPDREKDKLFHYIENDDYPIEGDYLCTRPLLLVTRSPGLDYGFFFRLGEYCFGMENDDKNDNFRFFGGCIKGYERVFAWTELTPYLDEASLSVREYIKRKREETKIK